MYMPIPLVIIVCTGISFIAGFWLGALVGKDMFK
jgi:hypothetical protein